jgi:hypothetical protein
VFNYAREHGWASRTLAEIARGVLSQSAIGNRQSAMHVAGNEA